MISKINIIGYLGFSNFGDDLMLYGLLNELNSKGYYKLNIFMKKNIFSKDNFKKWNNLEINIIKLNKYTNITLPLYIFNNDCTIWCGGTCLYEDPSDIKLEGLRWIRRISFTSNLLNRIFYLINIGVNEIKSKKAKCIVQSIINNTTKISVRDNESINNLKKFNNVNCIMAADLALLNKYKSVEINTSAEYFIFCGHFQYKDDRKIISAYVKILNNICIKLNKKILFVPLHLDGSNDNLFHSKIINELSSNVHYELIVKYSVTELENIFKNSFFVISMRLHALIFSELLGRPSIGINYNDKVQYFMNKLENTTSLRIKDVGEVISNNDILNVISHYKCNIDLLIEETKNAKKGILI